MPDLPDSRFGDPSVMAAAVPPPPWWFSYATTIHATVADTTATSRILLDWKLKAKKVFLHVNQRHECYKWVCKNTDLPG